MQQIAPISVSVSVSWCHGAPSIIITAPPHPPDHWDTLHLLTVGFLEADLPITEAPTDLSHSSLSRVLVKSENRQQEVKGYL